MSPDRIKAAERAYTVLIALPHAGARTRLVGWARELRFRTIEATDGETAWASISVSQPAVVVYGQLPGISGAEFCHRVRQEPAHASTYLLLHAVEGAEEDAEEALEAGIDDIAWESCGRIEFQSRLAVAARILESEADSERLMAALSSVLIGLDEEGRINRWNSMAERTFGIAAGQVMGEPLTSCGIQWSEPQRVHELVSGPADTHAEELPFRDREGRERLLGVRVTTLKHGAGGIVGQVVLGADVTERRVLEAQLRQSQKLEGIGQLAAGIAHELNTPMQYIGDNVRYLGDSLALLEPLFEELMQHPANADAPARLARLLQLATEADIEYLRKDLPVAIAQSLEGVANVSRIVRAMKEFSHPGTGQKEHTDLNHAIETTLVVARNEIKYVSDVLLELDPALPGVPCHAGEVNQVLLNLFVNAAHAIGDVASERPGSRGTLTVSTHANPDSAEIRIRDTGKGIPDAIRSRVFEPFFTTKDVGKGTGQGLAMAHATIVTRHGGQIWFQSVPGEGTTFFIRLPLHDGARLRAAG
jgi:PAS domain S-box-containing protein